jgi:single-strand DNA-binding protein
MQGFNRVILAGNIGADPELRKTSGSTPVSNFSLASSRRFTKRDGTQGEELTWTKLVVWGKAAEACKKYLRKGSSVLIEGRLQNKTWTSKDGTERSGMQVVVETIRFLNGPHIASADEDEPQVEPVDENGIEAAEAGDPPF